MERGGVPLSKVSPKLIDLTGQGFGNMVVLCRAGSNRQGGSTWVCLCVCGTEKVYSSDHLTRKTSPVKSCGCLMVKCGREHKQWKGVGDISGGWWSCHVTRERRQTDRPMVPCTVTIDEAWCLFLQQGRKCALSGVSLTISGTHKYNTASIDRIDNSKGYELGNIQWVHKHINFMKRDHSVDYFIKLCTLVADNQRGGKCGAGGCEVK